jgi:ParB-like chromosome segregation protein Spo0J
MHPERREKLEAVKCDHLAAHPLSEKIYGKPKPSKEFLDSIAEHGLLQPIIVNDYQGRQHVLAGNTRAVAWRMLWERGRIQSSWIPCRIVHFSPLEAERLIIESNRQREKTKGQKARETRELARIETALAKERMTLGVKSALGKGKATEIVARETHQSNRTVEKQIAIVESAETGNATALRVLAELDENKTSVSAAYREITQQKRTFNNSWLGQRVATLETLAWKLPNDLRDPANKDFLGEAVARIGAAAERLTSTAERLTSTAERLTSTAERLTSTSANVQHTEVRH